MGELELLNFVCVSLLSAIVIWNALGVMIRTHRTVRYREGLLVEPVPRRAWTGLYDSRLWHEDQWARENGFERAGACVFMGKIGVFWQRDEGHELLLVRLGRTGIVHQRITLFDEQTSISSSDRDDLLAMPRPPGRLFEARRYNDLNQLEAGHKRFVAAADGRRSLVSRPLGHSAIGLFQQMLNEQLEYVRAIPFYPLRAVLWSLSPPVTASSAERTVGNQLTP